MILSILMKTMSKVIIESVSEAENYLKKKLVILSDHCKNCIFKPLTQESH